MGLVGALGDTVPSRVGADRRARVTRNGEHVPVLHGASPAHRGILAVYQDDDRARDMSYEESADAVGPVEASTLQTGGQVLALDAWRSPKEPGSTGTRRRGRGSETGGPPAVR